MITLQALNNNYDSRMARKQEAEIDTKRPIAMNMTNHRRNDWLPIAQLVNRSSRVSFTMFYRNDQSIADDLSIYTYLSRKGMLIISLGASDLSPEILNLDDDSIHRLLCVILSHLFNFSDFSKDQMFYVNLGQRVETSDGYKNTKGKWYFGKRSLIEQLGADNAKNEFLYYDGANRLELKYHLNRLS